MPKLIRSEDPDTVAADLIAKVVENNPKAVIGLATGSTPVGIYKKLIAMNLDLSQVQTFNLDEYIGIPGDHHQSYRYFMQENLFKHTNIKPENIHFLNGMAENIEEEVKRYEAEIENVGINIQLLGIGSNGHIAFNEPGSPITSQTRKVVLTKQTVQDNSRFFKDDEFQPTQALTMGIQTILKAQQIVLVAKGVNKSAAVRRALYEGVSNDCPASHLQEHKQSIFIVDMDVDV